MSVKKGFVFKNKPLRLTTGEFIGVTVDHVNKPESRAAPDDEEDKKSLMYHDLCITKDENRAIICSYDGNFIESEENNCTEGGYSFDLTYRHYEKGNNFILSKHMTKGCKEGGGCRDFQIDGMTGKILFKPLVLGMRKDEKVDKKTKTKSSSLELVQYDSERAFRVKNLKVGRYGQFHEPQFLENQDGGFIGKQWKEKRVQGSTGGHGRYMDLCLTTDRKKAIECTYDGQYISTLYKLHDTKETCAPAGLFQSREKGMPCFCLDCCIENKTECVFDFSAKYPHYADASDTGLWEANTCYHFKAYCSGTQVKFTNNETAETRLSGGSQHFCFHPDGQIGPKPLALGKADTGTKLVVVDPNSPKAVQLDLAFLMKADECAKPEINVKVANKNKNYN